MASLNPFKRSPLFEIRSWLSCLYRIGGKVVFLLDPRAQDVVHTYLEAVDAEAPGLVEGLYLHGSVALGDFHLPASDIDFVAVVAAHLDASSTAALVRAHQRLRRRWPRPFFAGPYVTWGDLAQAPDLVQPEPYAHRGRFFGCGRFEINPITWHTLVDVGVVCRGPSLTEVSIWTDPVHLKSWTRQNLMDYWRPWHDRYQRLLSVARLAGLTYWPVVWGVLGVSRLHYTLATGCITSKTGAGLYAREVFAPRWQRVINEALLIRHGGHGSLYLSPFARRRPQLRHPQAV